MPNKETFKIKPIKELLDRYIKSSNWIDPFCGKSEINCLKNDLNLDISVRYHMDAYSFCKKFKDKKFDGALFDPPYSPRQIKECYNKIGLSLSFEDTQAKFWSRIKDILAKMIIKSGYVISFGWNSGGFGLNRGFKIVEILLVPHGGNHNDTIVVVEKKC